LGEGYQPQLSDLAALTENQKPLLGLRLTLALTISSHCCLNLNLA
jgi:hypothetical protein